MKKFTIYGMMLTIMFAENLIVDQSSMSQYEKDNYIYFDSFDFNGTYYGNNTQGEDGSFPDPIDRIYLPEDFPILGTQFTIEAWVFSQGLFSITNLSHRTIIGDDSNPSGNDQNRPPMITFQYDHSIRYGFGTGTDGFRKIVNDIRVDDEWIHVAFTFNGTTCKLFVNGELADSTDQAAGLIPNQVPISLIGRKFIGKMDEIRIWNTSREQEQIQSTMNGELNGDEEGLIAYYPMTVNENWQLEDYTENQNHATIDNVEILQEYYSNECEYPDGSSQCSFPTIRSALDVVESGDNITIRDGRYSEVLFRELLNFSHETEGPKITIEGDGENVILDGTISLNANWENSGGTYVAEVDMNDISKRAGIKVEDIYGLWVDDRYMIPAMPINFKNPTDSTTGTQNNPEPGTVWSLHLTAPYEYFDMVQDEYTVGDMDNLDGLEEWSFDKENSRLHLIPGNNIPDSTNVRVRIRTNILSFESSDNIEFKNIDFFAGTFFFHSGSFIILEDMNFSHSWESGLRHYELGIFWVWRGNYFHNGTNNTIRNCIFQYINDARPLCTQGSMNTLVENVLFRYNDWFKNTTWTPSTSGNSRGDNWWTGTVGPNTWRYITSDHNNTGGISPGLQSLVEYARVENQYIDIDGSGINRTPGPTVGSTTRYCWLLNTNRNGMRFDGGCAATDGMIHHVVSAGNKRGFRLKGDEHQAYHLTAYDNLTTDISMPPNKYCGDDWDNNDNGVENNQGNFNSQIHNCIVEGSLGCTSPDCGDPSITYTPDGADNVDENIANLISPEFLLNESGIWYGRMLNIDHTTPFAYPQLELQMPWTENRIRSEQSLISQFGENPFENAIQDYDFRPKKESVLIDGGVVVPGINDGQDQGIDLNHTPLYAGQNRAYIGAAPDIGAYEYGDSVYWIPGYRYSYPSMPIPSDGAIEVSMDYGLAFNYPWKTDYSGTVATVSVSGPGINRTETFQYPNNVLFESFQPGETYNWSVTVDGVSGGNWSFTVSDKTYPLNDRSLDTTFVDSMLIPYQTNNLQVFHRNLAFLKFDIPSSINNSCIIHLNLVPEEVETLAGGIVVYKYNYTEWGEKLDGNNIGLVDHSLLTPIDTIFAIETNVPLQIDISNVISADGLHSFALGVVDSTDHVTFYSKEKLLTDGEYIVSEGHLSETGGGSGYAPMKSVWPSLTFQPADAPVLDNIEDQTTNEDSEVSVILSATDVNGDNFIFTASSADTNIITIVIDDTLTLIPEVDWNGQTAITVIVTDDGLSSLSDTTSFTFTVNAVNDSPVIIEPLPDVTIDEDDFGAVIIPALEAHFVDIDEGDILSYTGSALGDGLDSLSFSTDDGFNAMASYHGSRIMTIKRSEMKNRQPGRVLSPLQNNRDKSVKQDILSFRADTDILNTRQNSSNSRTDSTALIVYPTENFVGDIDIIIIASDTSSISVADTLMLTIVNIGDAPIVINPIADIVVNEDNEPVTLNINGVFDDVDISVGDSLTITAISLADTLVIVEYDSNSVPLLVFSENGNGETDIIVTAADLSGLTANDTVHVTILPVNDAPAMSALADTTINEDGAIDIVLTASDIDEDTLTFSAASDTSAVIVAVSTDTLSVSLVDNWNGSLSIMVVVSDGSATDTTSFELTVNAVNDAPSSFVLNEQDSVYITMANFDSDSIVFTWDESADVDEDELTYHFTAELVINGQLTTEYDTTLTANAMKIDYKSVFDEIYAAQAMLAAIEWDVSVSDGIAEVLAENGPLTVGINASDAVLSIDEELLPEKFALHQNYPNPFNPITTLRYDLPENSIVRITIYNVQGREIKVLVNQYQEAGYKSVRWNATNDYGKPISAGMYFYKIRAGEFTQTRKMLLLK